MSERSLVFLHFERRKTFIEVSDAYNVRENNNQNIFSLAVYGCLTKASSWGIMKSLSMMFSNVKCKQLTKTKDIGE